MSPGGRVVAHGTRARGKRIKGNDMRPLLLGFIHGTILAAVGSTILALFI